MHAVAQYESEKQAVQAELANTTVGAANAEEAKRQAAKDLESNPLPKTAGEEAAKAIVSKAGFDRADIKIKSKEVTAAEDKASAAKEAVAMIRRDIGARSCQVATMRGEMETIEDPDEKKARAQIMEASVKGMTA